MSRLETYSGEACTNTYSTVKALVPVILSYIFFSLFTGCLCSHVYFFICSIVFSGDKDGVTGMSAPVSLHQTSAHCYGIDDTLSLCWVWGRNKCSYQDGGSQLFGATRPPSYNLRDFKLNTGIVPVLMTVFLYRSKGGNYHCHHRFSCVCLTITGIP